MYAYIHVNVYISVYEKKIKAYEVSKEKGQTCTL